MFFPFVTSTEISPSRESVIFSGKIKGVNNNKNSNKNGNAKYYNKNYNIQSDNKMIKRSYLTQMLK
jgi:hypothetical protein